MTVRSLTRSRTLLAGFSIAALAGTLGYGLHAVRAEGIPTAPTMYYSGTLEEGGVAVEGTRNMALRFYDVAATSGTAALCESVPPASGGVVGDVTVRGGRFRFEISDACVDVIRQNPNVLTELVVGGTAFPRAKVGAAPYAVEAEHALRANDATHAASADSATTAATATTATNATNATNATTAAAATSASGALNTRIGAIETALTTLPTRIQSGTAVVNTNASGDATLSYAVPFSQVTSIVASIGDPTSCPAGIIAAWSVSTTSFSVRTNANSLCRVNYIATGK